MAACRVMRLPDDHDDPVGACPSRIVAASALNFCTLNTDCSKVFPHLAVMMRLMLGDYGFVAAPLMGMGVFARNLSQGAIVSSSGTTMVKRVCGLRSGFVAATHVVKKGWGALVLLDARFNIVKLHYLFDQPRGLCERHSDGHVLVCDEAAQSIVDCLVDTGEVCWAVKLQEFVPSEIATNLSEDRIVVACCDFALLILDRFGTLLTELSPTSRCASITRLRSGLLAGCSTEYHKVIFLDEADGSYVGSLQLKGLGIQSPSHLLELSDGSFAISCSQGLCLVPRNGSCVTRTLFSGEWIYTFAVVRY